MAIQIDADDLIVAFKEQSPETRYFLNRDTGTVAMSYYDGFVDAGLEEGADEEEALELGNYVEIESIPSYEAFGVMEAYVESRRDRRAQAVLESALSGNKPFSTLQGRVAGPWRITRTVVSIRIRGLACEGASLAR